MKQFIYMVVTISADRFKNINYTIQDWLNEQGKNGWELVSMVHIQPVGAYSSGHPVEKYTAYFKKEKNQN